MTATYIALATIQLTSTDSEIVFSSIPATYRDLIIVGNIAPTVSVASRIALNGDTSGTLYSRVLAFGTGSIFGSQSQSGVDAARDVGAFRSNGTNIIQIFDYAQTNKHKTILSRVSTTVDEVGMLANRWANTDAINSISLVAAGASFQVGTSFSLYGIN